MMPPTVIGFSSIDLVCQKYACQCLQGACTVPLVSTLGKKKRHGSVLACYANHFKHVLQWAFNKKGIVSIQLALEWTSSPVSFDQAKPLFKFGTAFSSLAGEKEHRQASFVYCEKTWPRVNTSYQYSEHQLSLKPFANTKESHFQQTQCVAERNSKLFGTNTLVVHRKKSSVSTDLALPRLTMKKTHYTACEETVHKI